jgi:hypothetical protein
MSNNKKTDPSIFVLDRIEGNDAILIQGEKTLIINKKILPKEIIMGERIVLELTKESDHGKKSEKSTKDLLNEILASN